MDNINAYTYQMCNENGELELVNGKINLCINGENKEYDIVSDKDDLYKRFRVINYNMKSNYLDLNNPLGDLLIDEWVWTCSPFRNGFGVVCVKGKKHNYIDFNGKILKDEMWFYECDVFQNGFGAVQRSDGKWNYIGSNGKILSKDVWFCDCRGFGYNCGDIKLSNDDLHYSYGIDKFGSIYKRW